MNPPKPNAHSPNGPLVCITGGNGMIGRRLAERYRVDGFSVRIVSRHAPTGIRESAFFGADLLNADDVVKAFRDADRVVHLATPPSQPSTAYSTNCPRRIPSSLSKFMLKRPARSRRWAGISMGV